MKLEICCGNYKDALIAFQNGAERIELNSALYLGGLTPSIGTLKLVKKNLNIETICMVRPRAAGFCYDAIELEECFAQAKTLLENGADGLAFGFLNRNHTIDIENTRKMVNLIHHYHKQAVFHRALDLVADIDEALNDLIMLNVDRVLTSGLKSNVVEGADTICEIVAKYGNQIEILAGGGVNIDNVEWLAAKTKVQQVHSSCKHWFIDETTTYNGCSFGFHNENDYDNADGQIVAKLVNKCKNEMK